MHYKCFVWSTCQKDVALIKSAEVHASPQVSTERVNSQFLQLHCEQRSSFMKMAHP